MSLLDDVSIVVTPNGYKAGTLFAVKPTVALGDEEVTNGDFATDTDWTKGTGWTISSGVASSSGSNNYSGLRQSPSLSVSSVYEYQFTISSYTSGFVRILIGATDNGISISGVGVYSGRIEYTSAHSGGSTVAIFPWGDFVGSISNISVKEDLGADMDVTRATAATRVDEAGLVNYAEIIGSEEVTNGDFASGTTDWTVSNGAISIDNGRLKIDGTNGATAEQTVTAVIGKTYKVTYSFTLGTATIGALIITGGNYPTLNAPEGTNTFYTTATQTNLRVRPRIGTDGTMFVDNISVKEVTRDNVPRIDYTGGGCPHILAEPQRTNLITFSNDFSNAIWQKQTGIVPTYNTTETLSPDGTNNATKFIGTGSTGVFKSSVSVSGNISRSVYLKSVSGTTTAKFKDPNATGGATPVNLTITNEWQRFKLIGDNGTAFQGLWIDDITSDGLYMWGAQLEEGSYATSIIPTSVSTVTRNQDIFTRDGIGSLINSTEGVLFLEVAALSDDLTTRGIAISDGGSSDRVDIYYGGASNRIRSEIRSGGSTQANLIVTSYTIVNFNKIAVKWKENDFAMWINGVEVANDSSGIAPVGMNKLSFDNGSSGNKFFGKVKQLQVYKTALTDEQLIQLTGTSGTDFYESYAEMASALTYTIQ